ncbi:MAG: WHG domain-containing protein [Acidimicrobiales bacterium]
MRRGPLDTDQVVDAAARLVDAEGIEALTLTRVARELGVRQPAVPPRRGLRRVGPGPRSPRPRGARRRAHRRGSGPIGFRRDPCARTRVAGGGRPTPRALRRHRSVPLRGRPGARGRGRANRRRDRPGARRLDLDATARVHAARSLRSVLHGFAHLESGDGHPHPQDLDDSFDALLVLLAVGVGNLQRDPTKEHP